MDAVRPAIPADGHQEEPPVRFTLAGGRIGVTGRREYGRAAVDIALWLGVAPLAARLLARAGARRGAMRVQRWWAGRMVRTLGIRIDWEGLERIDPGEAYIVTPLHEGFADVLALLRLPLPPRFVGRDELAGWPVLGPYLRDTGQVIIRPEAGVSAYRRLAREARAVVGRGESLIIFPQGTILGIETGCFPGAFALARALDRPILPIALTGGHRVWEHPFGPRLRRGERLSVRVLPPIPAAEVREKGVEAVRREVCRRLKSAALDGTMAPPRRFVPARDSYWDGYAYEIDPAFPALAADIAARRAGPRERSAQGS
ncbi:MAG: 1-acyl-sn-glycerol-3-phosphate acyltransferase [Chloroflexota bacterium]|nr:1-acyl-sn-glycerol-3-phosphate acyltransferase [Chloroflexota bacterium]